MSERESWAISRTLRKVSSHLEWLRPRRSLLQLLMRQMVTRNPTIAVQSNRKKECKVQASIKQGRRETTEMHASRFKISLKAQWWNLVRRLNKKPKSQNTLQTLYHIISQRTRARLDQSRPQSVSPSTMVKVIVDLDPKVLLVYPGSVALTVEAIMECQGRAADMRVKEMLGMKPSRTTSLLWRNVNIRKDRQRALTKVHALVTLWTAASLDDLYEWMKKCFLID